jgi:hypothetical protein
MTELFGRDVHQHVVLVGIRLTRRKRLHKVAHGGSELAVGAAELLEQQTGEARIGFGYARIKLQLLDVVEHAILLTG